MARSSDFPEESELVVCTVQGVKSFGAFVSLDEYEGKEGFIHIRDVATGWVKYIRDYVREGQKIVCKVLGVDPSKGHIDLSLKSVNEHQKREKIQQWKNENKADKLVEIAAERLGISKEAAYEQFGYPLMDAFGSLYGSFEQVAADPSSLKEEGLEGPWNQVFIEVAKENVTPPSVQIDGIMEMTCPLPDGVDKIREALQAGMEASTEEVKIQYIGAPKYRVVVAAADYKTAEEEMKSVTASIISAMQGYGGKAAFVREAR